MTSDMQEKPSALLSVRDLVTEFSTGKLRVRAVNNVSFDILRKKTLGVVGESGSGKSVTAKSILRLLPSPPAHTSARSIRFEETELTSLSESEMQKIRGNRISMIFQEPMTALNPVLSTGEQVAEAIRFHDSSSKEEATDRAIELFKQVGIPAPRERVTAFPHEMSGGMRQRVMIAMALACSPDLLIADEPTTALDVTIQAQILTLLQELQAKSGLSILLITHDLGVVSQACDSILVMYAGQVVEQGDAKEVLASPSHHYTRGLIDSLPKLGSNQPLTEIPGMVPSFTELPKGCAFQERCPAAKQRCLEEPPELVQLGQRRVRCHFPL